jgi:hypothetical protein
MPDPTVASRPRSPNSPARSEPKSDTDSIPRGQVRLNATEPSWIVVVRAKLADFADQGTPPPIFPNESGPARGRTM